jgi:hypothetical protein
VLILKEVENSLFRLSFRLSFDFTEFFVLMALKRASSSAPFLHGELDNDWVIIDGPLKLIFLMILESSSFYINETPDYSCPLRWFGWLKDPEEGKMRDDSYRKAVSIYFMFRLFDY